MKDISTKKIIMTNEAGTGFRVRFLADAGSVRSENGEAGHHAAACENDKSAGLDAAEACGIL